MKRTLATLSTLSLVVGTLSCAEDPRTSVRAGLEDHMVCDDALRPSTLRHIDAALRRPDAASLAAVFSAEDLASVVSFVPQAEAVVVVGRNVWSVVDSGFGKDVVAHGWDGVQCGEPVTVQCTAGKGVSTVDCDDDGAAFAVTQELDRCTLHGVVLDGVVALSKDEDDRVAVDVDLVVDEFRDVEGAFVVDRRGLRATSPIAYRDHAGYSCAEEFVFDDLAVQADGETTTLALTGAQVSDDHGVGVDSAGVYDGACACPRPGSSMAVLVPRPFDETHMATAAIEFGEGDDDVCATVSVTVDGAEVGALAAVVEAMCAR